MALDPVDLLLEELIAGRGSWPPRSELRVRESVRTYRAFLDSDREALKDVAGWTGDRDYKVDPLGPLIADAWADHLFGEDVSVEPATPGDEKALDDLLEGNGDLTGDLHAAERDVVGEGERWWRVYADRDIADVPLLEWHGRDEVIPLYLGRRLLAVALVTELPKRGGRSTAVYRHFEIHVDGMVEHVLFRGTPAKIGTTVPLEEHPDLLELAAGLTGTGLEGRRWVHGLPMLMGRITNGRRIDRKLAAGVSDFRRIEDFLLDLNEAATIGAENARLTAKRRVVVPEESLRPAAPTLTDRGDGILVPSATNGRGQFDAGEDVLVVSKLDAELGSGVDGTFKVLEYSFDAEALIAYKRDLVETALTRVGITPQYVGVITGQGDGLALSGTALRFRLIPTVKAGGGKARPWDDALPQIIALMARLDALPEADGGFGRPWADPTTPPSVERANPIPVDEVEEAGVDATYVGAGLRSRETSVRRQHPDWSDQQVTDELKRIKDEQPTSSGMFGAGLA